MSYYLSRDGQRVGPYTETDLANGIQQGTVSRDEYIWAEGWDDWRAISVEFPNLFEQVIPIPSATSTESPSAVKQGAIIGGWVCFGLGIAAMCSTLLSFFLYAPFLFVSFILSIVALAQRRIVGGIALLVCNLIVPPFLWLTLLSNALSPAPVEQPVASRPETTEELLAVIEGHGEDSKENTSPSSFSDAFKDGLEKAVREEDLATLGRLREKKDRYDKLLENLETFRILQAEFRVKPDTIGIERPVIGLEVRNDTGSAVSRAFFKARLITPGRSVPWIEDSFNYEIPGGLEPGETTIWALEPNRFQKWGKIQEQPGAVLEVVVERLLDADGEPLFDDVRFSESEREIWEDLEEDYRTSNTI